MEKTTVEGVSRVLNHQFIPKLKLVVEDKFNYVSLTLPSIVGLKYLKGPTSGNQF